LGGSATGWPARNPIDRADIDRRQAISYLKGKTFPSNRDIMATRDIITIPDPILKTVSRPIETIDDDVRTLLDDMLETMYAAPGIGLAAVQIGIPRRLVVIDIAKDEAPPEPVKFINPEIVWASEELSEYDEGCLSIPDVYDKVTRPSEVKVRYIDIEGKQQERHCDGLLATCIQHEIDHLDGVLFIDYLSRLKRDRVVKKFSKAAKMAREAM
jgi:peptide deformylase